MIITCPNCKKKFNIDPTLINNEGRDLKCGSCDHVWHYKVKDVNSTALTLNENIDNSQIEPEENKTISKPGKILISGVFRVSSKITNAIKDIKNTTK